jgi:hypothetical protein
MKKETQHYPDAFLFEEAIAEVSGGANEPVEFVILGESEADNGEKI